MANLVIIVLTLLTAAAIIFAVPPALGLGELVKIAFVHIPLAWVGVLAFFVSAFHAAKYLKGRDPKTDVLSAQAAKLGLIFVGGATLTGAVFSKLTWGAYWNWDPRQTTILVLILIYGAYLTLRGAFREPKRRAKISAVYSLFSVLTVPFLVFILPRLYFSLHPEPILNASAKLEMDTVMLAVLILALVDATVIFFRILYRDIRR